MDLQTRFPLDDDPNLAPTPLDQQLLAWLDLHEPHGPIGSTLGAFEGHIIALACQGCDARVAPAEDHCEYDVTQTLNRLLFCSQFDHPDPMWLSDRPGEMLRVVPPSEMFTPAWVRERVGRGLYGTGSRAGDATAAAIVADVRRRRGANLLQTLGWHLAAWRVRFPWLEPPWEHIAVALEDIIPADLPGGRQAD